MSPKASAFKRAGQQVSRYRRPTPIGGAPFLSPEASGAGGASGGSCVVFDGKSADFATEMFVIINSTHTRINKSHLVDLYERVSWETPEKKFAAKVVNLLYEKAIRRCAIASTVWADGAGRRSGFSNLNFSTRFTKSCSRTAGFSKNAFSCAPTALMG